MTATADLLEQSGDALWHAVVSGDDHAAGNVVRRALDDGLDPESVLLDVIGGVQRKVGAEWAADRLTVAQEHAATAINERVIAKLSAAVRYPRPHRARIAVACVDGEWHALPARLLAEVLALRGFRVDYLGAQIPTPHLITHLHTTGPEAVALSGSLAPRLPTAHATITACQAAGTPVLVGGSAFGPDGRYARLLGADLWAPDARTAADLLAGGAPIRRRDAHQPIDDLPHLADQEYTLVARSATRLVRAVHTGLDGTDHGSGHTPEDLAHIVDHLCTALYTDDPSLLAGHVTWTAEILAVRGAPTRFLGLALDLLATELRDFPRATCLLREARTAIARTSPHTEPGPAA
ncbi:B12-binding domain-containing protein [Actinosynnema sp. NPDC047251]|uniref:cobalamin B12-binding domain-containing protein n=1 Tax=Saccharothrix espanaensis TaxID=103731 RepID=UPI0002EFEDC8|nr:B12-binding domain-containing protein [Saccharothrix espanaensis]